MSSPGVEDKNIAAQMLELQIDVALRYGIDMGARCIQLIGEIDENTFCYIDSALTLLEGNSKKGITIKINSEGGSLYDALAIVARIRSSKCKVTTEANARQNDQAIRWILRQPTASGLGRFKEREPQEKGAPYTLFDKILHYWQGLIEGWISDYA
jgi:hypothetical protein